MSAAVAARPGPDRTLEEIGERLEALAAEIARQAEGLKMAVRASAAPLSGVAAVLLVAGLDDAKIEVVRAVALLREAATVREIDRSAEARAAEPPPALPRRRSSRRGLRSGALVAVSGEAAG